MLKEAIDVIALMARQAAEPKRVESSDPRSLALVTFDGNVTKVPIPVPPRNHKVESLEDLIELAQRFGGEQLSDTRVAYPVVWYNAAQVVLVIDDDGHRLETATLDLVESDVFKKVRELRQGAWYVQKDFVRLLKIHLVGTLPDVDLLNTVRRLKFENGTVTTGELKKNRESMGREITAAVSAEGEIPDFVRLVVPVFKVYDLKATYPVNCTVEVDVQDGRLRLMPFPDEVERVWHLALTAIEERLAYGLPEAVPHYLGAP